MASIYKKDWQLKKIFTRKKSSPSNYAENTFVPSPPNHRMSPSHLISQHYELKELLVRFKYQYKSPKNAE
ncbi:MAG: hypothetical protein ACTSUA_03270 [Candidatus Heimdallarchaeota archaeon]